MTETRHTYTASCSWTGSTGAGYPAYSREHRAESPPALMPLLLSADPSFLGDPSCLNPEQLLVIAASSCQLLSFLALAARARIDVVSYSDNALGSMPADSEPQRITDIVLRPHVVVRTDDDSAKVKGRLIRLLQLAHEECYIANSLTSRITIEPQVQVTSR